MPTTVSTTPLTPADIQLLAECNAHADCTKCDAQISILQNQIAQLRNKKATAAAGFATVMSTILTSKNVQVPVGATVVRQTVGGVDSLLVQTA